MKKLLLLIAFFAGCFFYSTAQNNESSIEQTSQESEVVDSTTSQRILRELETIRGLQQEERTQRMKAVHYRDSLNKTRSGEANSSDYSVMSDVERNTRFNFWANGWNLIGVFALIVAIWSLIIARKTFTAQNETEKHTQRAPKEAQLGVLKDLPRHFYRNLACTCAAHYKFRSQKTRVKYPSEANILKLTTLPDEFILPIDSSSDSEYKKMHEEKLLFKNYNLEVEVAAKHFAIKNISDDSLKNDYDNLLFKPLFLTTRMLELQDMISSDGRSEAENGVVYSLYAFVKEHFEKVNYKAFIENKNDEVRLLKSIVNDSDFTKKIGVKDDSISRSLKMLLKYKTSDSDVVRFLTRKRDDGEFVGTGEIMLDTEKGFKEYFRKQYSLESVNVSTKGLDNFEKVFRVKREEDFASVFNGGEITANTSSAFKALSFYFSFMNKENWNVKDLLFTILKVDSVLEMSKIGMIEYQ